MGKPQRKPKTPARHIDMPKSDYQPTADEKKQEVDMPGVDLETARRAFFRPIKAGVSYGTKFATSQALRAVWSAWVVISTPLRLSISRYRNMVFLSECSQDNYCPVKSAL